VVPIDVEPGPTNVDLLVAVVDLYELESARFALALPYRHHGRAQRATEAREIFRHRRFESIDFAACCDRGVDEHAQHPTNKEGEREFRGDFHGDTLHDLR
jgi:hypothetical protein